MKKTKIAALSALAAVLLAGEPMQTWAADAADSAGQTRLAKPAPFPASTADDAAQAKRFVALMTQGDAKSARGLLSHNLRKAVNEQALETWMKDVTAAYGKPKQLKKIAFEDTAVHRNAELTYTTASGGSFAVTVRFDRSGRIDDLLIPALYPNAYEPPSYDVPGAYREWEITVGSGTFALPGTLTVPAGKGPFPVVVLVHGSGPNDRDDSIGGAKTFRDLAVGLAGQGVASLRYEKRTREHALKTEHAPFTVREETVDDAVSAIAKLRQTPDIDRDRIFVLGHSQGGMLIPRIVKQAQTKLGASSLRGAMVMAGPSVPIEDMMLRQYEDMLKTARQNGASSQQIKNVEQQLAFFRSQYDLLKFPLFSEKNGLNGFVLPHPEWWFDFRNYKSGELAAKQTLPMLILQGDNDMQVSPDNLDGWQKALFARDNIVYKLYPKLNHLFVRSETQSTGAEYMLPGNVPIEVVEDLAEWIAEQ
ncbi:hydrolase [Saccharibacillus sp. O23]|uniref:alpha/beta hydrolase family protein n=1 Tax=Saccharibacillus sp. O23 TaxID=2009338 RepID=UPI000B4E5557|nr:alpha/beta fold hydrolase [Saccharibacillus sp. O23]OWR32058.1 hydrolase [Saccharibacillus sp. O23]